MDRKNALTLLALLGGAVAQQQPFGQCGGRGWTGPTACVSGWRCVFANDAYSQCLEDSGGGVGVTSTTLETNTKTTEISTPTTVAEVSIVTTITEALTPTTTTDTLKPTTTSTGVSGGGNSTCGSAAVDELVGYGAGTTGGGSGSGTTVTSCAALKSAIAKAGVITISGILSGCDIMDLKGNTTINGVGSDSGLTGGGFRIKNTSNVIIRNLKFHNPPVKGDIIALAGATHVWIDHCDLSSAGITGDKDFYDGLLDITHASDFVTVSWTKFHDHWKGSLIGHSDSNAAQDTGRLHITYHHNHFTNVNSRLPSIRFGTVHIYSSCYENNPGSGVNSRMGAQVLVEETYFSNTKSAIITNLDSAEPGFAVSRNNMFVNSSSIITQVGILSVTYSYTTDSASCVCDVIKSKAGTGVVT